jgi:hypothetical protein
MRSYWRTRLSPRGPESSKTPYKDIYDALDLDYRAAFNSEQGLTGTLPEAGPQQSNLLTGRSENATVSPNVAQAPNGETRPNGETSPTDQRQRILAAAAARSEQIAREAANSPEGGEGRSRGRRLLARGDASVRRRRGQTADSGGLGEFQSGKLAVPQSAVSAAQSVATGLRRYKNRSRELSLQRVSAKAAEEQRGARIAAQC